MDESTPTSPACGDPQHESSGNEQHLADAINEHRDQGRLGARLHRKGVQVIGGLRVGVVAVVVVLIAASSAVAFWSGLGGGGGSASVGTAQALSVSPGAATTQLYPGGQADVALSVSNPNAYAVHVGSLSLDTSQGVGGFGVDSGHAGCGALSLAFAAQSNGGVGWSVPPKVGSTNGSLAVDLPGSLAMSAGAAGACQGASFSIYLSVGP